MCKFMAHFLLDLEFLRSSAAFYLRGFPKLLIYKENPKLLIYKEIVLERTADHCSQNLSESQIAQKQRFNYSDLIIAKRIQRLGLLRNSDQACCHIANSFNSSLTLIPVATLEHATNNSHGGSCGSWRFGKSTAANTKSSSLNELGAIPKSCNGLWYFIQLPL